MRVLAASWVLLTLLGYDASSQVEAGASVETVYDDNVNNNFERLSSPATAVMIHGGYLWDNEANSVGLGYTGGMSYFSALPNRAFHTHDLSLSYATPLDEAERTLFNAGAGYSTRVNREDYSFYDHSQFSLFGVLEHNFSGEIVGKAGYTMRSVRFAELEEFNYLEHYGFAQLTTLLPTNGTLILEADLGSKGYLTANESPTVQTGRRGRGQNARAADGPSITQPIGMARIGQPIVEGTGVSLTLRYQVNLQKESRYILSSTGGLSDDEFLEDHYGYEGPSGMLMLTQMLPGSARVRLSYLLQGRTYANRPASDLAGVQIADTRQDMRKAFSVQLSKPFESLGFTLGLSFDHIVNASNDPYYDYSNNALSFLISYGF